MSLLHADVVVVGTELCALGAAALLAHSGRRVVCIDDGEQESTPLGPFVVPRAPALWRLPASGPAADLLDKLGLRQDARRVIGDPKPIGLIDDPEVRLVIDPDAEQRRRELARALGNAYGDKIDRAFHAHAEDGRNALLTEATLLDEQGFFATRRRKRRFGGMEAASRNVDPAVRALVDAGFGDALSAAMPYAQWTDHAAVEGLGGFAAISALVAGSVAHDKDGRGLRAALRELFGKVVKGHGGEFIENTRITELDLAKVTAPVAKTDGKNHYTAKVIIDGSTGQTLVGRASRPAAKLDPAAGDVAQTGGAAIVRWLLPRASLPRGLPDRALLLSDATSLPPLLLAVYDALPPADKKAAKLHPDACAVLLAGRFPRKTHSADTDAITQRLAALMPFAQPNRLAHDSVSGVTAARIMPTLAKGPGVLGGRSLYTKAKSLLRAGRELCPALGLEGEMAAAYAVSKAAAASLKDEK